MIARYSAFALMQQGLAGHKGWPQAWRKATTNYAESAIGSGT